VSALSTLYAAPGQSATALAGNVWEIWLEIPGYPGQHVSSLGRVRSRSGRILTQTPDKDGYLRVGLSREGRQKAHAVHVVVLTAFDGEKPSWAEEGRHLDGVRSNNSAYNLRWGTRKQNAEDRDRHGTTARGARHGSVTRPESRPKGLTWRRSYEATARGTRQGAAKLNAAKVKEIRSSPGTCAEIAMRYQVSKSLIAQIRRGLWWRHV